MLNDKPPEHWADAPLNELEAAIRAIGVWTERDAELADFAYVARTMRILGRTRAGATDEAQALADHLRRAAHDTVRDQLDGLDQPYFARWRLLAELLVAFAMHLEVPDSVLGRKHVLPILVALHGRGGAMAQSELTMIANEGQRSALLKFMESWDLVERTPGASGHSRTVAITDLGRLAIADQVATLDATARPRSERFIERMTSVA